MTRRQKSLHLIAALILLLGWGSALVLYVRARTAAQNEAVYGYENSKPYRHALETFGGTMNVYSDELIRWWEGLWQGTTLPLTLAGVTAFTALVLFLVARIWPHGIPQESLMSEQIPAAELERAAAFLLDRLPAETLQQLPSRVARPGWWIGYHSGLGLTVRTTLRQAGVAWSDQQLDGAWHKVVERAVQMLPPDRSAGDKQ